MMLVDIVLKGSVREKIFRVAQTAKPKLNQKSLDSCRYLVLKNFYFVLKSEESRQKRT